MACRALSGALHTMPMQPSGPLEQQIYRRKITHHHVHVIVQTLLKYLSADDNQRVLRETLCPLADTVVDFLLQALALVKREAGMQQDALVAWK